MKNKHRKFKAKASFAGSLSTKAVLNVERGSLIFNIARQDGERLSENGQIPFIRDYVEGEFEGIPEESLKSVNIDLSAVRYILVRPVTPGMNGRTPLTEENLIDFNNGGALKYFDPIKTIIDMPMK